VFFTKFWDVYGLAWGVALGALMHLLIQIPTVRDLGYKYKYFTCLGDKNLIKIFKMMIPRVLGLATTQINLIVVTIFGSMIAAGSITVFNLANNLQSLPLGLIGISFAIAAFPTLSNLYAKKDFRTFNSTLNHTIRMILFGILPFTVLFIVLRYEIVELILGSGKFNEFDMRVTADTLGIFSISLFAQSLIPLLARTFFARHNSVIPFVAGVFSASLNILLAWFLAPKFAVYGLTTAFSISAIVNFVILLFWLRMKIGDFDTVRLWNSLYKIFGAAVIMGIVVYLLNNVFGLWSFSNNFIGILFSLIVLTGIGVFVFLIACTIFKCKEINYFKGTLKKNYYQWKSSRKKRK
jgi:putative peptidoglycan lipid II flippase